MFFVHWSDYYEFAISWLAPIVLYNILMEGTLQFKIALRGIHTICKTISRPWTRQFAESVIEQFTGSFKSTFFFIKVAKSVFFIMYKVSLYRPCQAWSFLWKQVATLQADLLNWCRILDSFYSGNLAPLAYVFQPLISLVFHRHFYLNKGVFILIIDTAKTILNRKLSTYWSFSHTYAHIVPLYRNCWHIVIEPSISSIFTYGFGVEIVCTQWNDSIFLVFVLH